MSKIHKKKCFKCKKIIATKTLECTRCIKYYHPGCVSSHSIRKQRNNRTVLVPCPGPIEEMNQASKSSEEVEDSRHEHGKKKKKAIKRIRLRSSDSDSDDTETEERTVDEKIDYLIQEVSKIKKKSVDNKIIKENIESIVKSEINRIARDLRKEVERGVGKINESIKEVIQEELIKQTESTDAETVELKRVNRKLQEEIDTLHAQLRSLRQEAEPNRTETKNKENSSKNDTRTSYAQVARNSKKEEIIILPVDEQTSEVTVNKIRSNVDIMGLGVGLDNVVKGPKGKIILRCQNEKDKDVLTGALKENMGEKYKVYAPNKKLPKIKIVGIEETVEIENEKNFIEKIRTQNQLQGENESYQMKIIKKSQGAENLQTVIMEVDPKTHKYLVEKRRMKVGWVNCPVYDYVSVVRCFNCWGYNHFAKDCRNEKTCRRCGGAHDRKECKASNATCINCCKMMEKYNIEDLPCNHEATDVNCEAYKIVLNRNRKNIQYGEE